MTVKNLGFTMIELLIVIVIIGVLAALISTNLYGARSRALDTQKKNNLNQLKIALHTYYANYHLYPPSAAELEFMACGSGGTTLCSTSFIADNITYMDKLPKDNLGRDLFLYYSCNNQDDFRLKVNLTNSSDSDIAESQAKCPSSTCVGASLSFDFTDYVLCAD